MKSAFDCLPKPRSSRAVPNPDMAKLDAVACQVPSRSMPESEATPVPAPEIAPTSAPAAAPAPEAERVVQLSGRITESDSMKLRLYCIQNKLTTQEWMRQAIRALP